MIWKVWALVTAITLTQVASDEFTVIVLEQPKAAAAEPEWRLVMFTADWCAPCKAWKRDHLEKVREEFPVELVDIDKAPETRRPRVIEGQRVEAISRVPTFWLVKRGQKKPTKVWVGGRTLQQIQQVVDSLED
jgi:thiol-disulfide isomerase/thioredoxin